MVGSVPGIVSSWETVAGIGHKMYTKIRRKIFVLSVVVLAFGFQIASSELFLDILHPNFLRNSVVDALKNYGDSENRNGKSDSDLCVRQFSSIAHNISNKDVFPGKILNFYCGT